MAELASGLLELPLSGGLKQQVDKRLVQPGAFLAIENLEHAKAGVLTNRRGYGYLADPGREAAFVATRGSELVAFVDGDGPADAPCALAYHEGGEDEAPSWSRSCDAWQIDVSRRAVVRSYEGALCAQRVVVGDRVVYVWVGGLAATGSLFYRVEDAAGVAFRHGVRFASGAFARDCAFRLVETSGKAAVVYYNGVGTTLRVLTLDPVTFAETDANVGGLAYVQGAARRPFDAKSVPVAPGVVAVAVPAAPTGTTQRIKLATVAAATGAVVSDTSGTTTGRDLSAVQIRFTADGNVAGVAYRRRDGSINRDDVYVAQFSGFDPFGDFNSAPDYDKQVFGASDALEFQDPPTVTKTRSYGVGLCQDTAIEPGGWVVVTCNDWGTLAKRIDDAGDVAGNDDFFVASAHLLAEPFSLNGRVMALLGEFIDFVDLLDAKNRPLSAALVSLLPGIDAHDGASLQDPGSRYLVAAALLESVAGDYTDSISVCAGPAAGHGMMAPSFNADGSVSFAATVLLGTVGVDAQRGIDEVRFDPAAKRATFLDASAALWTSGGLTAQYDGQDWAELGFLHRATVLPFGLTLGPGPGLDPGNYLYAAVYEWRDARGAVHQSEPAIFSIVVDENKEVTFEVRCVGLTQKPGVSIAMYRTQNNGVLFFRISPRTHDGSAASLHNDPGVRSVVFSDALTDAQLAALGRGFLYTNSGARAHVMAPPSLHACRHQNRLWLLDAEDPNRLRYSNEIFEGQPPCFGRGNELRIDGLPSAPTALASSGDRLCVFTADGIYYLVGQGPDDTGANGSFSPAYQVPTTCGCTDPRSVLSTHLGTFFLGQNGIMLFGAGGGVAPVGQPAEDEVTGAFCRRVVLDEVERKIYWLFASTPSGDPVSARLVVHEYDEDAWLVHRVAPTNAQRDQCLWKGGHVMNDGRPALRGFGPTPAADPDGSYVSAFLRLPWVNLGGINGFQRFRRFLLKGRRNQPCNLRVRFFVDHDDVTATQNKLVDLSNTSTLRRLPILELSIDVKRQLNANAMVEISHEPAAGATNTVERAGVELVAPAFELGVKKGPQRLAKENRTLCRCPCSRPLPLSLPSPASSAGSLRTRRPRPTSRSSSTR